MLSHRTRWTQVAILAALPVLGLAACKKKKSVDEPTSSTVTQPAALNVVSLRPGTGEADRAFRAQVLGSAFEPGARVVIGTTEMSGVEYVNSNTLQVNVPGMAEGTYDVRVTNANGDSALLRSGLSITAPRMDCQNATVNFAFDSSKLESGAISALSAQIDCYRSADITLRVEGHTDERGTVDYNLALGERRANAVRAWLTAQGIPSSQVRTTSYGEERPVDSGHHEGAWAANRRAEILIGG